nr:ATP-binding protein [uncultured Campylobacter sp.]
MVDDKKINGSPAKSFFVHMLTRDIDLDDAVLDLIDNSLDGLLRVTGGNVSQYREYGVNISIKEDEFIIEDNCGGIPTEVAKKYAFRMGRPGELSGGEKLPTVGLYGIGMKRSVFKMGKDIKIITKNNKDTFCVKIDKKWLENDDAWDLTMSEAEEKIEERGTRIVVKDINPGVSTLFSSSSFASSLLKKISVYYAFALKNGFKIVLNDIEAKGKDIKFLFGKDDSLNMKPYFYQKEEDGLKTTIICGLIGQPDEDDPTKDIPEESQGDKIDAGWTIACNNRVVVYADKTMLTGWGDGLPKFHYQFNSIVGIVNFESDDPSKLPMTTTKKGVDTTSDLFFEVRRKMIEGAKYFKNYTNKWKNNRSAERKEVIKQSEYIDIEKAIPLMIKDPKWDGETYKPMSLPTPESKKKDDSKTTIKFEADKKMIEEVAPSFTDSDEYDKNEIGLMCLKSVHKRIKSGLSV